MKYLCLDIGNVLVNQDIEPFVRVVSMQMNLSKEDSIHFVNRIQKKQDLGLTTVRDELITHFNIKSEYIIEDLMSAWNQVIVPNQEAISYIYSLVKMHNLKVALLSNIGEDHLKHITNTLSGHKLYDESIHHFSCRVGARKPTSLYYKLFLDEHPEFKGAMYLDDLNENLETGAKLGFKTLNWDLSKCAWGFLPIDKYEELRLFFEKA